MSKFSGIEKYLKDKEYRLLPFKFDRYDQEKYILTNLIGEYHFLSHEKLQLLANKKLSHNDSNIPDLRAKHFIYYEDEKAPIELLGLKIRTKYSKLPNFTSLHIFVVSLRCDHSCPYCQVSRQSEDKAAFDMTKEIADKALDFVFRSPSPAVKIEFQGGEPLLNFEIIKYVVTKAEEINQKQNRDLEFVIATTLSLITDEILEFCKEHSIILSSSLDGPEDLHNANRPRPGKNSHQKFVEGLERARSILGFDRVSALMTTTESSLTRAKEIIDEYIRLGFDGVFLRQLSPYGFAIKTKKYNAYQADRWFEFYKEGLNYIIELNKSGFRFIEHYTSVVLAKMLTSNDPGYVDLMNPSGAGIAAIVFNYNGYVYASDESRMLAEMGDETFRLGHLLENSYEEIILSDKLIDALDESFTLSSPMCSDCSYEQYCGAEPVFHYATQKDFVGRKPESEFCKKNMNIFKYLLQLMEDDPKTKEIFLGWANRC
jgi:His-Xaa-Ser system radical SAM maturase HxsB